MIDVDFPSLQSMPLCGEALAGRYYSSCSLRILSKNEMILNDWM